MRRLRHCFFTKRLQAVHQIFLVPFAAGIFIVGGAKLTGAVCCATFFRWRLRRRRDPRFHDAGTASTGPETSDALRE